MNFVKSTTWAAVVLASSTTLALAQSEELVASAQQEGEVVWCNGFIADTVAQEIANQFEAKYPGVRVNGIRSTSQVAYQRLLQDIQNDMANCDVYSSSDASHFEYLMGEGLLMEFTPENAQHINPAFAEYYKEGYYYPALMFLISSIYNSNVVSDEEAPASWDDFLDEKWHGRTAIGHAAFSGAISTFALQIKETKGLEWLESFAETDPLIGRSANDAIQQLNSGERDVAIAPSHVALSSAWRGNPIKVAYPTDGSVVIISPAAVMDNAPHPNAARLFMEFFLGEEYSEILSDEGALPLNVNVPLREGIAPLDTIAIGRPSVESITDGIPEVIEDWRDIFGN